VIELKVEELSPTYSLESASVKSAHSVVPAESAYNPNKRIKTF